MSTVLSTKKLAKNQRSLLLNAGLTLVEYNAIKIDFVPFEVPENIGNAIFTSQNAVLSIQNSEFRIVIALAKKQNSLWKKAVSG